MRTCPPGTSWYSLDSAQQTRSGSHAGTVTAASPPGRSTRAISAIARRSRGTCSRISAAMTRSNESSGNGSLVASAVTGAAAAGGAASPSARMAANMPRTGVSSPLSRSAATTCAPRR